MQPQELIVALKAQHKTLLSDLANISNDLATPENASGRTVVHQLEVFKRHLEEHMKLENDVFYTAYLEEQQALGYDVVMTKTFISQMDDIGRSVMNFLDKYSTPDAVDANITVFAKQLHDVQFTLKNRIETEEEGVFDMYLAQKRITAK